MFLHLCLVIPPATHLGFYLFPLKNRGFLLAFYKTRSQLLLTRPSKLCQIIFADTAVRVTLLLRGFDWLLTACCVKSHSLAPSPHLGGPPHSLSQAVVLPLPSLNPGQPGHPASIWVPYLPWTLKSHLTPTHFHEICSVSAGGLCDPSSQL